MLSVHELWKYEWVQLKWNSGLGLVVSGEDQSFMESIWLRYYAVCKNEKCAVHISIPHSNLLERSENIACPKCGHVFFYTPDDQKPYDDIRSFEDPELARMVGIVNFGCPEEGGEGLVEILLPIAVGQGREYVSEVSTKWKIREAYCKCGKQANHILQAMPQRGHYSIAFSVPTPERC